MTLESPHQVNCESGSPYQHLAYAPGVIQEIGRKATAQFLALPRGGLEVGGVLYGIRSEDGITILSQRELEIEYLTGPSFVLSENDEEKLRALLEPETPAGPEGEELEAIGWWHSHTRSDVSLTEADVGVHRNFFGAAGSVALVVKPFKFEPPQFALYTPAESGTAVCCSFTLPKAPAAAKPAIAEEMTALAPVPPTPVRAETRELAPRFGAAEISSVETERRGGLRRALTAAGAAAALLGLGAAGFLWLRPVPPPEAIRLEVNDTPNGLVVHWNAANGALSRASGAELVIADGAAEPKSVALRADDLRSGTLTYVRKSDAVRLRLRVRSRSGTVEEAVAHFIGSAPPVRETAAATPPPSPAAPAAKPAELSRVEQEVTRLNAELRRLQSASPKPVASDIARAVPATGVTAERSRAASVQMSPAPSPAAPAVAGSAAPEVRTPVPVAAQLPSPPPASVPATSAAPLPAPPAAAAGRPAVAGAAPTAVPAKPVSTKPATGRAIWTGHLGRGAVLSIDSRRASMGDLTGRMPSRECRVRVYGGELRESGLVIYTGSGPERVEPPSAANGWNVTTFRPDSKRSRDVALVEAPNKANGWQRLIVRSERPVSVLLIEWEEVGN